MLPSITLSAMFPAKREFSVSCLALLGTYRERDFSGDFEEAGYTATCQLIHSSIMSCAAGALRGVTDDSAKLDMGSGTLPLVGSAFPPSAVTGAARSADTARPINLLISYLHSCGPHRCHGDGCAWQSGSWLAAIRLSYLR